MRSERIWPNGLRYLRTNALLTAEINGLSRGLRAPVAWAEHVRRLNAFFEASGLEMTTIAGPSPGYGLYLAFSGCLCPPGEKTARECQSDDS